MCIGFQEQAQYVISRKHPLDRSCNYLSQAQFLGFILVRIQTVLAVWNSYRYTFLESVWHSELGWIAVVMLFRIFSGLLPYSPEPQQQKRITASSHVTNTHKRACVQLYLSPPVYTCRIIILLKQDLPNICFQLKCCHKYSLLCTRLPDILQYA